MESTRNISTSFIFIFTHFLSFVRPFENQQHFWRNREQSEKEKSGMEFLCILYFWIDRERYIIFLFSPLLGITLARALVRPYSEELFEWKNASSWTWNCIGLDEYKTYGLSSSFKVMEVLFSSQHACMYVEFWLEFIFCFLFVVYF